MFIYLITISDINLLIYLNFNILQLKTHWSFYNSDTSTLEFYGLTKDPESQEFMMITQFADKGNLRHVLSSNFNDILWNDKINQLLYLASDLKSLHELGYFHKDFHSGNILQTRPNNKSYAYISDFGLSGPSNEQKSDDKICGVLPYIAPEVLNGKPYTLSSDIYSFGVVMAEVSSGNILFTIENMISIYLWQYVMASDQNLEKELLKFIRNWLINV